MSFAADRLITGLEICDAFELEQSDRSWHDKVLPYGLAEAMLITPSGWTYTEDSRVVRLPRG